MTTREYVGSVAGVAQHSRGITVEQVILSDGSVAYTTIYAGPPALRFGCANEDAAWAFADALSEVCWVDGD